jgi:hypothetical protein
VKRVDKNELDDLQTSDVLLPPDLLLQAGQEVVVIPVCTDVVNVVYGMTSPRGGCGATRRQEGREKGGRT